MMKSDRRYVKMVFFMAILLAAAGFAFAEEGKIFSHKLHADEGAECTDCHDVSDGGNLLPNAETCAQCHEDTPMFGARPAVRAKKLPIKFPHTKHAESLECKTCHEATIGETQKPGTTVLTFDTCKKCHGENGVEVSEKTCAVCHGVNMQREKPSDHKKAWIKRHGKESTWREFEDHGQECSLCHREQTCKSCHRVKKPASHTGLWRNRLHGKSAEWDRGGCKTCHETGTCIRCHRQSRPGNHKGNWRFLHSKAAQGSTGNCKVCHRLYEPKCTECHAKGK